jgi:hypothetical protein
MAAKIADDIRFAFIEIVRELETSLAGIREHIPELDCELIALP